MASRTSTTESFDDLTSPDLESLPGVSEPVKLVDFEDGKFVITDEGRQLLTSELFINPGIKVIGIAGGMRTGKSYLLSRLNGSQTGFALGGEFIPCTNGVWGWKCQSMENTLLLDFEGMFDPSRVVGKERYDIGLFYMACLFSSFLIYNTTGVINRRDLDQLKVVVNVARHVGLKRADDRNTSAVFPYLQWVLRDVTLKLPGCTPREHLDSLLTVEETLFDDNDTKHQAQAGLLLKTLFQERDLHYLNIPCAEDDLQRLAEGQLLYSEMRPEFQQQATELVEKILRTASPKKVPSGEGSTMLLDGTGCLKWFEEVVNAFNTDSTLVVADTYTMIAEASMTQAHADAKTAYIASMESHFVAERLPISKESEQQLHATHSQKAIEMFRKCAAFDMDTQTRLDSLWGDLEEIMEAYSSMNMKASEEKIRKWCDRHAVEVKRQLESDNFKSFAEFCSAADEIEELYDNLKESDFGPWKLFGLPVVMGVKRSLLELAEVKFQLDEAERQKVAAENEAAAKVAELTRTQAELDAKKAANAEKIRIHEEAMARLQEQYAHEKELEAIRQQEVTDKLRADQQELIKMGNEQQAKMVEVLMKQSEKAAQASKEHTSQLMATMQSMSAERTKAQEEYNANMIQMMEKNNEALIQATKNRGGGGGGCCFPASATVRVLVDLSREGISGASGPPVIKTVQMRDVREGDMIATLTDDMKKEYQEVYYAHGKEESAPMIRITCASPEGDNTRKVLRLTDEHLVYVLKHPQSTKLPDPVVAESVVVGDYVLVMSQKELGVTGVPWKVVKVKKGCADYGRYTVLTKNHRLLVDGILASSFEINQTWGIIDTVAMRLLYRVSPGFVKSATNKRFCEVYDNVMEAIVRGVRGVWRQGAIYIKNAFVDVSH